MYSVTEELPFCYGHRLLAYAGKIFDRAQRAGFPVAEVQVVEQWGSIASYCP
jgi:hypothetical protein